MSADPSTTESVIVAALVKLDDKTFAHCRRVQVLAFALGQKMGLTSKELARLRLGSLLHDIGKKDISTDILNKKAPLTHEEWELIQMHPVFGWNSFVFTELDDVVKRIILDHHLWANGEGGYPNCFENFKPCPLTQITSVADVVDAMTNDRPYRLALSVTACFEYLEENAGTKFNREVVEVVKTLTGWDFVDLRHRLR